MKIFRFIPFSLFGFFFLVLSCQETEEPLSNDPSVKSISGQVLNEGGVIVSGELSRFNEILNHGFYVASDTTDWEKNSDQIELGRPSKNGKFEKKVVQNILSGKTFFFRAFIQTQSTRLFGKTLSFVSKGGLLPTIERVEPEKGHLDEIIKVYGERFGNDVVRLRVFFDNVPSQNYTVAEKQVEVLLPYTLTSHEFMIRMVYYDGPETKIAYSLATPVVQEVVPERPNIGDVITLKGNHFDRTKERNEVFLGGKRAEIIQSSREELKVKIPEDVAVGELDIVINAQLQSVKQEIKVRLQEPILENFPSEAKVGQELEIKGQNFNPEFYWNKVLINGVEAQITDGNTNFLKFIMPDIPYPTGEAELKVVVAGVATSGSHPIKIKDSWVMTTNQLPFYYFGDLGTFVINNTAFVLARSLDLNDNKIYLYKFNPEGNSWTKISIPISLSQGAVVTQTEDKAYLYTQGFDSNFWEYNPIEDKWTQKANFPGNRRDRGFMFQAQGKIYLGPGVNFNSNGSDVGGFFSYDPSINSWKELKDPFFRPRNGARTFVFGDRVFVFDGANDTGDFPVYKYDLAGDSWSETNSQPSPRFGTVAFIYDGKGYSALSYLFSDKNMLEFDPATENWSEVGQVGLKERRGAFSFVLNNAVYVGGGGTSPEGGEREMLRWIK